PPGTGALGDDGGSGAAHKRFGGAGKIARGYRPAAARTRFAARPWSRANSDARLGAQATGETYTRAGELCEQLGRQHPLGAVRFGQFTYQNLRGEFRLAREIAAAILQIGHARNDASLISLGHHFLGYNYIGLGEFVLARAELEQKLVAVFDP